MEIRSVSDKEFQKYGKLLSLNTAEIVSYLINHSIMPKEKNIYVRDETKMHSLNGIDEIREEVFGNGPMEVGYCNGYNSHLNCLEYHACPEVDIAGDDLVLLLARQEDLKEGKIHSEDIQAFLLKKGQAVMLFPYIFHFSPCKLSKNGFRCAILLSDGTNRDLETKPKDQKLWKENKWLFSHKDSLQAKTGAYIGIEGENLFVDF